MYRCLIVLAACGSSTTAVTPPHSVDGFASPESVLLVGDRRFVSNMGPALDPLAKDGDGFISELDAAGQMVSARAFAGLNAPKGMASIGSVLYVADIDRVVGFDLASRDVVFTAEGGELLNDLAVTNDHALVVTDTLRGTVERLDLATKERTTIATNIAGANGIVVDGDTIYVCSLGTALAGGSEPGDVVRLDADGSRHVLAPHGLFDGIALDHGALLVSSWVAISPPTAGRMLRIADDVTELPLPEAMHGPADFAIDHARHQLWIPRSLDQRVSIIDR